jgi:diguanylate cyclase (GGDEF)-like protein
MRTVMPVFEPVSAAPNEAAAHSSRRRAWTLVAVAVLVMGLIVSATVALLWRASETRREREAFDSTSSSVSATLGTLLRRDADFVSTIRSVLTMQPDLSATQFDTWYHTLQGQERQVGGLGTAVVEPVQAAQLKRFLARRNSDAAFQSLVGTVQPVPVRGPGPYCLLIAGTAIVNLDSMTSRMLQQDWCSFASRLGAAQGPLTSTATNTGQALVEPTTATGVPTMFIEAAFYRRGAPLDTVAQRQVATLGWVLTTFDVLDTIKSAIAQNQGLTVSLDHRNPGEQWIRIGASGSKASAKAFTRSFRLEVDGSWRVEVTGERTIQGMSAGLQGTLVFGAGALVSGLLFLLLLVLARSRDRALGMVAEKTVQLRHQALHDALTGLPNRVLALDRADQMLARARRNQAPMAALYIDIDGFKHVNDTFGHAVGDDLLRGFAARLRSTIREADTAARLSGDEFLVLLDASGLDAGPQLVAERLLDVIREPLDLGPEVGRSLSVTASIGIANGLSQGAEQLVSDADVALYVAKSNGKNRCVMFESDMQTAAQDRLRLEMDLADALASGELFLVYQPTFDLRSERTVGVEALLRWRHPERGLIMPDAFIPIAEDSGLIVPIGRWVLDQACHQAAKWRRHGHAIGISVNVSPRQLERPELLDHVRQALEDSGLDAPCLTLEITEATLVRHATSTIERLAALKALGVRIAIDDFGTGYSSLAYLRQFPVDALKIDRSFTWGIAGSRQSEAVVQTLVRLGKTLELETIAEGIEDHVQLSALKRQQCDHGQGFLFAHPLEVDDLERFLESHGTEALAS